MELKIEYVILSGRKYLSERSTTSINVFIVIVFGC